MDNKINQNLEKRYVINGDVENDIQALKINYFNKREELRLIKEKIPFLEKEIAELYAVASFLERGIKDKIFIDVNEYNKKVEDNKKAIEESKIKQNKINDKIENNDIKIEKKKIEKIIE